MGEQRIEQRQQLAADPQAVQAVRLRREHSAAVLAVALELLVQRVDDQAGADRRGHDLAERMRELDRLGRLDVRGRVRVGAVLVELAGPVEGVREIEGEGVDRGDGQIQRVQLVQEQPPARPQRSASAAASRSADAEKSTPVTRAPRRASEIPSYAR